ncbi:Gfo/Idh/MocA family protein [Fictibacillus terranigra]|uniref:Gfo/Idh/MocA family oxidoreductase n=1 Tax=Fictibacillus terranigra TaxID=3058424 RepID=A0ABT8E192_9BACL|nr:Gfo/Idh/MocA family oxidoreductase [Fictibacillus sp. CENA-BCM004]MDN4071687.1 Gfo/Idh/MocA family oxidoreductase [Fictibacillus sp. CENA-BCM004]
MINVALLSKWHVHAADYAKEASENKGINITLVWDEDRERGEEWAEELGVPFEADLGKVLSNSSVDGVIVAAPTTAHTEIIIAAANHGKHIFTEKVLAPTVKECDEIFSAAEEAGVQLMVSLPRLTERFYLYAQKILDEGCLGKLTSIRCRVAHHGAVPTEESRNGWLPGQFFNKEEAGGGALIDLGAHPIYLSNRLGGKVKAVTARLQQTNGYDVDDNAVVILEFESGALGTIETGFLSYGCPDQLELYGTEGTLLTENREPRELISDRVKKEGVIMSDQLPEALPSAMEQWVAAITSHTAPAITKEDIRGLTLVNEAAALSHKEGRRVELSEIEKCVSEVTG